MISKEIVRFRECASQVIASLFSLLYLGAAIAQNTNSGAIPFIASEYLLIQPDRSAPREPIIVNTEKFGDQVVIAQTAATNGDHIILWGDTNRSSASFAQIFNGSGERRFAHDFFVEKNAEAVGIDKVGNFVILFTAPDGSGNGIFASIYGPSGQIKSRNIRLNRTTLGNQISPFVSTGSDGGFIAAWHSVSGTQVSILVRRFSADGVPLSDEIIVSSARKSQAISGLSLSKSGTIFVTWTNFETPMPSIRMRRFNSSGLPLGAEMTVNTAEGDLAVGGVSSVSPDDQLVVVWGSQAKSDSKWRIYAQLIDRYGTRQGPPFRVDSAHMDYEPTPKVAMAADGSFVVTWQVDNRSRFPSQSPGIFARHFLVDKNPSSSEFVVSDTDFGFATFPTISSDPAGNFRISWREYSTDSGVDVATRQFRARHLPPIETISSNQSMIISGEVGSWKYFKITVPRGVRSMTVSLSGPINSEADLYLNLGGLPTLTNWEIRPYLSGSNETVIIDNPPAGDWYIGVYGRSAYSNVSVRPATN